MKNILILFSFIFLFSCSEKKVFEKHIKFDNYEWSTDNKLTFEVLIKDTATFYNIYIPVRHTDNYPYDGLLVYVTTIFLLHEKTNLKKIIAIVIILASIIIAQII